jgi:hypothetical protein
VQDQDVETPEKPDELHQTAPQLSDFEIRIICAVIPGSPPSVAPRNDQAEHMIGFIESLY